MSEAAVTTEYWTVRELRAFLKLERASQYKTWRRVQPLFDGALADLIHHKLYNAERVRDVLAQRWNRKSPVSRSYALRRVTAA